MKHHEQGYIIETIAVGGSVKVTAIDPHTMREATVIVPPTATKEEMTTLAVKKLQYLLQHKDGQA